MWPVDFVRFPDVHANAVLPVVFLGVHFDRRIVFVASAAQSSVTSEELTVRMVRMVVGSMTFSVVLTDRKMFRAQVPVNVNRSQALLVVWRLDRFVSTYIHATDVANGNITAGLLDTVSNSVNVAIVVRESTGKMSFDLRLLASAGVHARHRRPDRRRHVHRA